MIQEKLQRALPSLSPIFRKIAFYILDHGQDAAFSSIHEMSEAIGVSNATLIRFVRTIGLKGYADFKHAMQEEIKNSLNPYQKIAMSELDTLTDDQQLNKLFANEINNLRKTLHALNHDVLRKIVKRICAADRVFVSGFGVTRHIVRLFEHSLLSTLDKHVVVVSGAISDYSPVLRSFGGNDVLILFTFPPYSAEGRHVASVVHENGGDFFLFTDSARCPVYPLADAVVKCENNSLLLANSFVGLVAVAQILVNMIYLEKGESGANLRDRMFRLEKHGYDMIGIFEDER